MVEPAHSGFSPVESVSTHTMARHEQDREDLLRDATALVQRVEFVVTDASTALFVGFRSDGCASVYIDQDPVYHFNSARQLRRAFAGGLLYKADHGRLLSMVRERTEYDVGLRSSMLTKSETAEFLQSMRDRLTLCSARLKAGLYELVGQVPLDADVTGRALSWLAEMPEEISIAASPRVC